VSTFTTVEDERVPVPRDGVIFDVDGTLVDTNYIHTICWWQALAQSGQYVSMARVHRAVGMGAEELIRHVTYRNLDAGLLHEVRTAHGVLFGTWREQLWPLPGAKALLMWCWRSNIPTVVASSGSRRDLEVMLELLGDPDIDLSLCSSDVGNSKPHPDLVRAAAERADLGDHAVVVGDSVWDVQAAKGAGLACIGMLSGGTSREELMGAGAVAVFGSPADLLEHWIEAGGSESEPAM
jgi:HAD superfamily hydrolase (TIGR01549 family)